MSSPPKSDLIYDVGLHRGEDTLFYMQKGYRVIAFEANPALVRHCSARFAEEIKSKQLVIVSGAIGPRAAATIPFYVNQSTSVWGTASKEWAQRNENRGAPASA